MKKTSILPFERILSLEESRFLKEAVVKAVEVFESWGYDYIKLPTFDHYEIQKEGLGDKARNAIVIKELRSGNLLSLRADFTTQVVRSVTFLKRWHFPMRLYYFGTLFSAGDTYESFQVGIELVGAKTLKGDVEVITALYDYIRALGIKDATVSVGHVNIVRNILNRLPPGERNLARQAFKERNVSYLRTAFGGELIPRLPFLHDREEAISAVLQLGMEKEARELEEVGDMLSEGGVRYIYDLSEVRELPYYTGIVFEMYLPQVGYPIGGGGRYDDLSRLYGEHFPATGGGIYIDRLLEVISPVREKKDLFIVDTSNRGTGSKLARILRAEGYKVGVELTNRAVEHSVDYAFGEGYVKVVVILDERNVRLYTTVKEYQLMSLKELLKLLNID